MRSLQALTCLTLLTFSLQASVLEKLIFKGPGGTEASDEALSFRTKALASHLTPFLGQPISDTLLTEIKKSIASYYQAEGYPFVAVQIPTQEIAAGTLIIQLNEGKVGQLTYKGNKWFSDQTLSRFIHLKPGEAISQERLLNDLTSLNRSSFHSTKVVALAGTSPGTTDFEFVTQDRFPLRIYGGADNTGIDTTGEERYYAGFNWGNAWGIGDLISYQWTTAGSAHLFNSHYLSYTSYLSWYHTLKVYGAYAKIHPKMTSFASEGQLVQGSARYIIPFLPLYSPFRHEISVGADFKRTNSSLFFADAPESVPLLTKNVNLTQLAVSYHLEDRFKHHFLSFDVSGYLSPAAWLPDQAKADFNSLRAGAKPQYGYGELSLREEYTSKYGSVLALLRGQVGTGPLLPSEQFGLGGYETVRGYDERDFDADNALCFNLEFRSPEVGFLGSSQKNHLIFLAFLDYGVGHNYDNKLAGIPASAWLLSMGPGLRLLMYPYLTARVDYGFQLHKLKLPTQTFGKLHFSVTASY